MSRRGRSDEPSLFDLPLVPEDEAAEAPAGGAAVERQAATGPARGASAAEPDRDEPELDEQLFAPDALAFDPLVDDPLVDDPLADGWPGGRPAGRPAAPPARPPAFEEPGFPFTDRPPPHRPAAPRPASPQPPAAALAPAADPAGWDVVDVADAEAEPPAVSSPPAAAGPVRAGLGPRLAAAAFDGLVLVAAAALALIGTALLEVRPGLAGLPGLAALLLVFSFAYSVVPLAFWGATPGMRLARLVARDRDGGPLTFGQTALRWLGGLVTLALAGLPMLLALGPLGARSPADRLSRSLTWLRR
jgi:uncharacterized RDD family membrane protein YckC